MKSRSTYSFAGIYGLLVLVPQYFVEAAGVAPTIALPEFFYGFLGVAVAFQLVFIIISTDRRKSRQRFSQICTLARAFACSC